MNTNAPPPPPPPPPEDPYPPIDSGDNGGGVDYADGMSQGRPSVAANPGRVLAVLGVVGFILAILLYNVFFGKDKKDEENLPERQVATAPVAPPPPLPAETPIFSPPPVPEPVRVEVMKPEDDSAARAQLRARLHSSMVLADTPGGDGGGLSDLFGSNEVASDDPNLQFQSKVVKANSKAERAKATFIGNLNRTIAQGRLIQATLESAVNTELPAPIRAIVSRDTFGEAGTEPLIPKGSRLIGQYSTDLNGGQSRVFVVWTRVIRPDGVDVMLGSPLVDQIGQAGIGGQVDNKFQQIFSRSIMASIISIGFAIGVEAVNPGDNSGSSTTTSTFGTTQSGDAASSATINALNRLGSTTEGFLQRFINAQPTILVDQGTPVNVFVNRDLVFPAELTGPKMVN